MRKLFISVFVFAAFVAKAQQFEEPKLKLEDFKDKKVEVGAALAMQYQSLSHSYVDPIEDAKLIAIGNGFNLPTANFSISGYLAPGIKANITTYLSSRHHQEAWVKDGYLLMDAMKFFNNATIDSIMNFTRFKIGMMEMNYGDAHFRRSDNGNASNNPFVGNYILDAFTTSVGFEAYYQRNGFLGMLGVSNGALKPELAGVNADKSGYDAYNVESELAYLLKFGYDKQFTSDFRLRATASAYISPDHHKGSLYSAERAGSRYYLIMNQKSTNISDAIDPSKNHTSGRYSIGSTIRNHSYMFNLSSTYKNFEFFGTYEWCMGKKTNNKEFDLSQIGLEELFYFGAKRQFYVGARYNLLFNNMLGENDSIERLQFAAGWSLTNNLLAKVEYVRQTYKESSVKVGKFDGLMVEFAISF